MVQSGFKFVEFVRTSAYFCMPMSLSGFSHSIIIEQVVLKQSSVEFHARQFISFSFLCFSLVLLLAAGLACDQSRTNVTCLPGGRFEADSLDSSNVESPKCFQTSPRRRKSASIYSRQNDNSYKTRCTCRARATRFRCTVRFFFFAALSLADFLLCAASVLCATAQSQIWQG